jgi:hypothetical protein
MSQPQAKVGPYTVLPIAYLVLRLLVLLNWSMLALIIVMLVAMPNERWIMSAFNLTPSTEASQLVMGMRFIALLGAASVPLHNMLLQRLLAICDTVRDGDPFVSVNATRLKTIAQVLLALQILSIVIDAIGKSVEMPGHPLHLNAGFSWNGWLAVFLTFLLAHVFAEGTRMRDELAGTV